MSLTLAEKFQTILEIKNRIEALVKEANQLLNDGGTAIIEELYAQRAWLVADSSDSTQGANQRAQPRQPTQAPDTASNRPDNLITLPTTPTTPKQTPDNSQAITPPPPSQHSGKTGDDAQEYVPNLHGPLKGKTLADAVETVMKEHFAQSSGANRQILAVLADKGFDGFPPHSQDTPMELLRRALLINPNIERPNRKAYIWKPKDSSQPKPVPLCDGPISPRSSTAPTSTHSPFTSVASLTAPPSTQLPDQSVHSTENFENHLHTPEPILENSVSHPPSPLDLEPKQTSQPQVEPPPAPAMTFNEMLSSQQSVQTDDEEL